MIIMILIIIFIFMIMIIMTRIRTIDPNHLTSALHDDHALAKNPLCFINLT